MNIRKTAFRLYSALMAVRRRPKKSIKSLYGFVQYDGPPVTLEAIDDAIAEAAAEGKG